MGILNSQKNIDFNIIDKYISSFEFEKGLCEIERNLSRTTDPIVKCNLILLQAWIFYLLEDYNMAHMYLNKIESQNTTITSQINMVRSLVFLKQGKYMLCHNSINKIDKTSDEYKKMMKILQSKLSAD